MRIAVRGAWMEASGSPQFERFAARQFIRLVRDEDERRVRYHQMMALKLHAEAELRAANLESQMRRCLKTRPVQTSRADQPSTGRET